jgi:hypothetical protein
MGLINVLIVSSVLVEAFSLCPKEMNLIISRIFLISDVSLLAVTIYYEWVYEFSDFKLKHSPVY